MKRFICTQAQLLFVSLCALFTLLSGCSEELFTEISLTHNNGQSVSNPTYPQEGSIIPAIQRRPVTGHIRGLVLLIQFAQGSPGSGLFEFKSAQAQSQYNEFFNGDAVHYPAPDVVTPLSSVKRFFIDQSNGKFILTHEVSPVLKLSKPRTGYTSVQSYVMEALAVLDRDHPSFLESRKHLFTSRTEVFQGTAYSYIRSLNIVFAGGSSGGSGSPFSAHSGYFYTSVGSGNVISQTALSIGHGLYVSDYQITPEAAIINGKDNTVAPLGILCHELGHLIFDFRDYYDNVTAGLGYHCLMSDPLDQTCPPPLNPYLKWLVGWAEFKSLPNDATKLTIGPNENNTYYAWVNPRNRHEMYILENRFKQGGTWTQKLISEGLGVWHVDATKWGNAGKIQWIPNAEDHYEISFVQACLGYAPERAHTWNPGGSWLTNKGFPDDCFGSTPQAATAFSHTTTPASTWWSGLPSGVSLSDIKQDRTTGNITLRYDNSLTPPPVGQSIAITDIPHEVWEGAQTFDVTITTQGIADGGLLTLLPPDGWKTHQPVKVVNNKAVVQLTTPELDLSRNSSKDIKSLFINFNDKIFECPVPHSFMLKENNPPLKLTAVPSKTVVSSVNESYTLTLQVRDMIKNPGEDYYSMSGGSQLAIVTSGQKLYQDGDLNYTFRLKPGTPNGTIINHVTVTYGNNVTMNGTQYHTTTVTVPLSPAITVSYR